MQQTRLHGDIAALSADLPGNQPRISVIREQLADIDRQIGVEAEKVLRGLSNIAKAAKLREDQLAADLDHARAEATRAEDRETELRSLQREAAAAREQLESYLARYRQAQSRSSSNYLPADALAISTPAIPQEPYF
ncbi:chain-length determining protein, partial [Escherichia coli]|nr:hypothetical protein [Escherichia coli]